ncbi:hypothetical protein ACPA2L_25285 [Bacillus bombysepticus]
MKSLAVDKKKKKWKENVIGITVMIIFIALMFTLYKLYVSSSAEKEKLNAMKIEQARNNVEIAEEMVAKELNTDSKYFRMISKSEGIGGLYDQYLDVNTKAYWIDQELKVKVHVDKKSYVIHFETKRVSSNEEDLEMYKPIGIYKILREE